MVEAASIGSAGEVDARFGARGRKPKPARRAPGQPCPGGGPATGRKLTDIVKLVAGPI